MVQGSPEAVQGLRLTEFADVMEIFVASMAAMLPSLGSWGWRGTAVSVLDPNRQTGRDIHWDSTGFPFSIGGFGR